MSAHRNLELDRLRAFAVLMVVFVHYANFFFPWQQGPILQASIWHVFVNSWSGVDLFFVISGFIISTVFIPKIDQAPLKRVALKHFFVRRFFRIFPVAFVMFLLVLLASICFKQPEMFATPIAILKGGGAIFTGWFNFYFAQHETSIRVLSPYWSLSLEEQFYLCFPLFLLLVKGDKKRILVLLSLLLLVTFYIRLWVINQFYYTQSRCDGLLYGCLLYYLMQSSSVRAFLLRLKPFYLGNGLGLILIGLIAALPSWVPLRMFSLPVIGLLATLLVALSALEAGFISFGKLNGILNYLGSRSYSVYLVHLPMMMLTQVMGLSLSQHFHFQLNASLNLPYTLVAVVLILGGTELSYRWIEKPFLNFYGAA